MFGLLGYPERMNLAETFNTHGYDLFLRTATVRFMKRFLIGGKVNHKHQRKKAAENTLIGRADHRAGPCAGIDS